LQDGGAEDEAEDGGAHGRWGVLEGSRRQSVAAAQA
jgi:hypothetical protein